MFVLERFVPEMTVRVTVGALRLGTRFRMLLRCEQYAMICMVWRALVPQTTLCVPFGARRRWVPLSLLGGLLASGRPKPPQNSGRVPADGCLVCPNRTVFAS